MRLLGEELSIQKHELEETLHFASLEKIFIEERIYKDKAFEDSTSMDIAVAHIDKRIEPFKPSFVREVTREDILKLMENKMGTLSLNLTPRNEEQMRDKDGIEEIENIWLIS